MKRGRLTLSSEKGLAMLPLVRTKPKRYVGRGDLRFITMSCYQRKPLLGTARGEISFEMENE